MIVYGQKAKLLASETFTGKCTNCGTIASVEISIVQKYFHIFWIPFVPIGKTGVSKCSNCKQVLKQKNMPPAYADVCNTLKAQVKTPVYMFSGLILLVVIMALATYRGTLNQKKNATLITAPQKGDIYEVKTKEGQYTLYKVDGVIGDTVIVLPNNYETSEMSGLDGLKDKGETAYAQEPIELLKPELKKMFDNNDIVDIDRK